MGVLIEAKCSCGFVRSGLSFGMGMKRILAPAICLKCKEIIELDYVLKRLYKCKTCGGDVVFYNNQYLQDWQGKNEKSVKEIEYFNIDFNRNILSWALDAQKMKVSDEIAKETLVEMDKEGAIRRKFALFNINYLCPSCFKFGLKFSKILGSWD